MAAGMLPALALLLGVPAACCLLFSWRGARRLQTIAAGLATVADGGTIRLPTDGFAGELADTVNRTSEQLRRRNEIIARRDDARTSWIAGVSHDVRTPLALILGWAEQLEQDTALPAAARQKACGIRTQSEKLRALIEDLNLTSKLQYGAQPLRCQPTQAGPLLRRLAAEFCDSPLAASCTVALEIAPDADKAILATRPPCCTPCRPVKRGRIRPTFWVCTSSSRSSTPTAARRPLPGTHRAGQRPCWCCR